jgi:hypothetical protein
MAIAIPVLKAIALPVGGWLVNKELVDSPLGRRLPKECPSLAIGGIGG